MTTSADLVIANGTVVTEDATFSANIAIQDGKIIAVGPAADMPPATETLDATGLHVLPGVIDVHVHFREPGMEEKEDWETGSTAAVMGGVTTVFEMPNTDPPVDTLEHFELKNSLAQAKSYCDFGIYGVLAEHNLDQLEPMAEAGAIGFKLFLGNTTGNLPCPSDGAVLEGFEILARMGKRCSIHAENSPNSVLAGGSSEGRRAGSTPLSSGRTHGYLRARSALKKLRPGRVDRCPDSHRP